MIKPKFAQYVSSMATWVPSIKIFPPLSEGFSVYGDDDTNDRARRWAYHHRYALVRGIDACAHGFYMMNCPGNCQSLETLDHVDLWVDCSGEYAKAFLLAHPYMKDPHKDSVLQAYARAHGIRADEGSWYMGDQWYSSATPPVKLTMPSSTVPFPIEIALPSILTLSPIKWRCEKHIIDRVAGKLVGDCQLSHDHSGSCDVEEDLVKITSLGTAPTR